MLRKPLLGEVVFVGGSTTALLITDKAAEKVVYLRESLNFLHVLVRSSNGFNAR